MARKIVLLLLAPFMIEIATGCCDCDNVAPPMGFYSYKAIQLENLDNRGADPVVSVSGPYLREAYGLRVHLYQDLIARAATPAGFFTSAYAFSCRCNDTPSIPQRDSITDVRIITLRDFDASHSAGADISDLFRVHNEVYHDEELLALNEYITSPALNYKSSYSTGNSSSRDITFDILLFGPPPASGLYKFNIQFILSDGRVLEEETPEIELM